MKSLLAYYLKTKWHIIIILSVICVIIPIAAIAFTPEYTNSFRTEIISTVVMFFGLLLSTVIPMFVFSFKMKKKNVDQLYSLGISRSKLFLSKYIFGLIVLVIPITIAYLPALFNADTVTKVSLVYLISYYVFILLSFISIYTIISFVYTRANTIIDGIITSIIYIVILVPIVYYICDVLNLVFIHCLWFTLYSPTVCIYRIYELIFPFNSLKACDILSVDIFSFVLFGLATIGSFILFIIIIKKDKAEDAGQISDSYFGYKTLIPILIVSLLSIYELHNYVLIIFTIIGAYLLTSIYKRSFKLNTKYYFIVLGAIALGFILNIINF